jgi:hypothetical protein
MDLLNKFFILEYLNITRCLESISTLCPGAQSIIHFPISTNIDHVQINPKIDKLLNIDLHLCLSLTEIALKHGIILFVFL